MSHFDTLTREVGKADAIDFWHDGRLLNLILVDLHEIGYGLLCLNGDYFF